MVKKTLYHGSTTNFDNIDVNKGKGYKDFGKGFYMYEIRQYSERMAIRNKNIEISRLSKLNKPTSNISAYLYTFEVDFEELKKRYAVRIFAEADIEWVKFILSNRASKSKSHNYDIVVGATADDDTRLCLDAYNAGAYGKKGSNSALEALVKHLEVGNLPKQYYFGSNEVINFFTRKGMVKL